MANMEKYLISIIIPVYNVELYLENCLDSIRKQTYKNFEVILVDDGSTDNSGLICDEYIKVDKRFKTIHQANKGVACARNVGIKEFKGDFITFVDSDDKLGEKYLEKMVAPLIEDISIDVTLGRVIYVSFSGAQKMLSAPQRPRCVNRVEALRSLVNPRYGRWSVYAKMFRSRCVDGVEVDENLRVGEDFECSWRIFRFIDKACYVDVEEYYYLWHPKSLTNNISFLDIAKHNKNYIKKMNDAFVANNPTLFIDMSIRFVSDFYNDFKMSFYRGEDMELYYYEFKDYVLESVKFVLCDVFCRAISEQFSGSYKDFLDYNCKVCKKLYSSKRVYVYGAGRNSKIVAKYLKSKNIEITAFVVSPGEIITKSPDGEHDILYVNEIEDLPEATIFLALILRNAMDVFPHLKNVSLDNVIF